MGDFAGLPRIGNLVGKDLDDNLLENRLSNQIRANFLEETDEEARNKRQLQALQSVGVDSSLDLKKAKSAFVAERLSKPDFIRDNPTLAASLASKQFAQTARDDLGNVIDTDGWFTQIANAYNVSRDTVA